MFIARLKQCIAVETYHANVFLVVARLVDVPSNGARRVQSCSNWVVAGVGGATKFTNAAISEYDDRAARCMFMPRFPGIAMLLARESMRF
jgi:hypothetical protein